jgi:hypothetical protein
MFEDLLLPVANRTHIIRKAEVGGQQGNPELLFEKHPFTLDNVA